MKIKLFIFLLIVFFSSQSYSGSTERKITQPLDIIATGGAGVAAYDKFGMLYMNPASFAVPENPRFSILKTGIRANWGLMDFYNLTTSIAKNNNDLSKLSSKEWKSLLNLNAAIGVSGPLTLGYLWDGLGLLLYNDSLVSVASKPSPGLPSFAFGSYLDLTFMAGFGFKLPQFSFLDRFTRVYGGVNIKYINRMKYENLRMSYFELMDLSASIIPAVKHGYYWGQAIGSDIGLLLKSETWSGGMVIRDWFTTQFSWNEYSSDFKPTNAMGPIPPTYYSPSVDIGGSYRIKHLLDAYNISDLTFYLDLVNIADFQENFFLKFRAGTEISLFNLFKIRGGIYKGYLTAGFGIVFPFVTINAAYYTEELGNLPGSMPQENYTLEMHVVI